MDSRELAYFVAVAQELHFGRAADRLGMAQPPLSRAIKQLEHRLGVELFERTSRKVVLTAAGEVLLHEGQKALDALNAAQRRTQRAGEEKPRLVLVLKPAAGARLLESILAAYAEDPDSVPVDVLVCGIGEQAGALRDGRGDVGILHAPHDDVSGFDTEVLSVESAVAVLPSRHRLAGRESLVMADLAGEPLPRWPGMSGGEASGPEIRDGAQLKLLIALGKAVAVLPESVKRDLSEGLVTVPVLDGTVTTVMLAWPERSRSRAVAAFVRAAVRATDWHERLRLAGQETGDQARAQPRLLEQQGM
jgi:DNA-binding transcriptional LysR family regulator